MNRVLVEHWPLVEAVVINVPGARQAAVQSHSSITRAHGGECCQCFLCARRWTAWRKPVLYILGRSLPLDDRAGVAAMVCLNCARRGDLSPALIYEYEVVLGWRLAAVAHPGGRA